MHSSSFKLTVALNSALLFWKPLVFEFLLGISGISLCSMSVCSPGKTVLLLDALQLLVLFAGTHVYLEEKLCLLNILYNLCS
jgi:hypothetical protein